MPRHGRWWGPVAAVALVAALGTAAPAAGAEPTPAPGGDPTSQGHSHEHTHEPATPAPPATPGGSGHQHEAPPPDEVPTGTRVLVLGGFGLVNAAALGSAVLLRRRDRARRPHQPHRGRR